MATWETTLEMASWETEQKTCSANPDEKKSEERIGQNLCDENDVALNEYATTRLQEFQYAHVFVCDRHYNAFLRFCATNDWIRMLDSIHNELINTEARKDGYILACEKGNAAIVQFLLETDIGSTTIQAGFDQAARNGHCNVLKIILAHQPTISIKQAFIKASKQGDENLLRFLRDNNQRDEKIALEVALFKAASHGNYAVCKYLCEGSSDMACRLNQHICVYGSEFSNMLRLLFEANEWNNLMQWFDDYIDAEIYGLRRKRKDNANFLLKKRQKKWFKKHHI